MCWVVSWVEASQCKLQQSSSKIAFSVAIDTCLCSLFFSVLWPSSKEWEKPKVEQLKCGLNFILRAKRHRRRYINAIERHPKKAPLDWQYCEVRDTTTWVDFKQSRTKLFCVKLTKLLSVVCFPHFSWSFCIKKTAICCAKWEIASWIKDKRSRVPPVRDHRRVKSPEKRSAWSQSGCETKTLHVSGGWRGKVLWLSKSIVMKRQMKREQVTTDISGDWLEFSGKLHAASTRAKYEKHFSAATDESSGDKETRFMSRGNESKHSNSFTSSFWIWMQILRSRGTRKASKWRATRQHGSNNEWNV